MYNTTVALETHAHQFFKFNLFRLLKVYAGLIIVCISLVYKCNVLICL